MTNLLPLCESAFETDSEKEKVVKRIIATVSSTSDKIFVELQEGNPEALKMTKRIWRVLDCYITTKEDFPETISQKQLEVLLFTFASTVLTDMPVHPCSHGDLGDLQLLGLGVIDKLLDTYEGKSREDFSINGTSIVTISQELG